MRLDSSFFERSAIQLVLVVALSISSFSAAHADDDVIQFCSDVSASVTSASDCDEMATALMDTVEAHGATVSRVKLADESAATNCVTSMEDAIDDLLSCAEHEGVRKALARIGDDAAVAPAHADEKAWVELQRLARHALVWGKMDSPGVGTGEVFPVAPSVACTDEEPNHAVWSQLSVVPVEDVVLCYRSSESATAFVAWTVADSGEKVCVSGSLESGEPVLAGLSRGDGCAAIQ